MCTVIETSVARKHKSLLGNGEAQFNGLDGFSHGDTGRWVGYREIQCMHVFAYIRVCVCVCSCFDCSTIDVLHFFKER